MRRPDIVATVSLVAGLVVAVPMAIVGFEFIRDGHSLLGGGFLGLALALAWFPEYVRKRLPHPWRNLKRRVFGSDRQDE